MVIQHIKDEDGIRHTHQPTTLLDPLPKKERKMWPYGWNRLACFVWLFVGLSLVDLRPAWSAPVIQWVGFVQKDEQAGQRNSPDYPTYLDAYSGEEITLQLKWDADRLKGIKVNPPKVTINGQDAQMRNGGFDPKNQRLTVLLPSRLPGREHLSRSRSHK